ncbi:hypothetical protein ACFY3U_05945 [Micromonospora sp. NPDC000089]|uniref:hypothetical protein n=1 Tax=unclassified Micromonospora TaxID=2617518 RepID=UPI0036B72608
MTAEGIALGGTAATTAWASVAEFLPAWPKAIVGVALGAVATWSSFKAWKAERTHKGGSVEDR